MFEEIIGQNLPKKILSTAITTDNINHAYIFFGDSGVGKMTMAKKFSQHLICKNRTACNLCIPCKQFLANTVDDFKIIDLIEDKTEIVVEQIRELTNDVYIRPHIFSKKIYIINNADKMNQNAQNAFLKVFEEPPEYAVFILIATNIERLLPTIRSRGNEVRFSPLNENEIKEVFKTVFKKDISPDIIPLCDGNIKTALSLSQSDETAILIKELEKDFSSFLKSGTEKDMLNVYKIISKNEKEKEIVLKILYLTLNQFQNDKTYEIYLLLNEFSKRVKTNANYSLTALALFLKMRRILRY